MIQVINLPVLLLEMCGLFNGITPAEHTKFVKPEIHKVSIAHYDGPKSYVEEENVAIVLDCLYKDTEMIKIIKELSRDVRRGNQVFWILSIGKKDWYREIGTEIGNVTILSQILIEAGDWVFDGQAFNQEALKQTSDKILDIGCFFEFFKNFEESFVKVMT